MFSVGLAKYLQYILKNDNPEKRHVKWRFNAFKKRLFYVVKRVNSTKRKFVKPKQYKPKFACTKVA